MAKHPRTGLGYLLAQKSLMALCMALLILPSSAGAYLGVYICIYLFLGCGSVAETTLPNREAPSAQRAGILSLYSFTLQAGGLVSALMGYLIATRADFRLTWIVGAAVMLAAVAMIAMRRLRREQA
jgi:predicted MFS family arabinose efflux permease